LLGGHPQLNTGVQKVDGIAPYSDGIYDYIYYLWMGFKLSPTANQDNHHMNWGSASAARTGILSPNLSESSVMASLDNRKTFSTEDRNAKILFYAQETQSSPKIVMGNDLETKANSVDLVVGYEDADSNDNEALVRIHFYRSGEALEFNDVDNSYKTLRVVSIENGKIVLPPPTAQERAVLADASRYQTIKSGQTQRITIPVVSGTQYIFVEVIQLKDFDKLVSAPVWISKP
jgi:hypothetical protein